jgi:hypothetical protein
MIRPEPGPGQFWPAVDTGTERPFIPKNIVAFNAAIPEPPTDYPHLTEDRVVAGRVQLESTLEEDEFRRTLARIGTTVEAIFGANLRINNGKAYVKTGTQCASLGGVNVGRSDVRLFADSFNGKKRPRMLLSTPRFTANMSITATDVRERFRREGINAIDKRFDKSSGLHLRLGLARGFSKFPNRCYMQINGIYQL